MEKKEWRAREFITSYTGGRERGISDIMVM
jgi:hypothetical protein